MIVPSMISGGRSAAGEQRRPKTPIMIPPVRIRTISIFIQEELTPTIMQPPVRSNGPPNQTRRYGSTRTFSVS